MFCRENVVSKKRNLRFLIKYRPFKKINPSSLSKTDMYGIGFHPQIALCKD